MVHFNWRFSRSDERFFAALRMTGKVALRMTGEAIVILSAAKNLSCAVYSETNPAILRIYAEMSPNLRVKRVGSIIAEKQMK